MMTSSISLLTFSLRCYLERGRAFNIDIGQKALHISRRREITSAAAGAAYASAPACRDKTFCAGRRRHADACHARRRRFSASAQTGHCSRHNMRTCRRSRRPAQARSRAAPFRGTRLHCRSILIGLLLSPARRTCAMLSNGYRITSRFTPFSHVGRQ